MWPGMFFTAIGLFFVIAGVRNWAHGRSFIKRAVRAGGTVTDLRYERGTDPGKGAYAPVLEFRTRDGRVVQTTSWMARKPPIARVGEAVSVLYDPDDPRSAVVDRRGARGGLVSVGWIVLGGIATVIGAVVLSTTLT